MKKNIVMMVIAIIFLSSSAWGFSYKGKTVLAQNSAPTTATTKSGKFIPKPVSITPAMVKAAVSYTDAQDIRAEMEKMKQDIQSLKQEDKKIWSEIKGLWGAVDQVKTMIKTAISNITAAQARAEEAFKKAEVADKKATEAKAEITGLAQSIEMGVGSISNQIEKLRNLGIIALIIFGIAIIGLAILSFRNKS